jgi:hypothetical protein
MDKNLRNIIVTKVLANIPPHIRPIDYLIEVLHISRESVYRRIRGDISFTMEEIATLSCELGFSVDEFVGGQTGARFFFDFPTDILLDPSGVFFAMIDQHYRNTLDIVNAKHAESFLVLNYIRPVFAVFFDELFKFLYYRWMHQSHETSLKYYYSDVVLPDEIVSIQEKLKTLFPQVNPVTIILDPNIFIKLMHEILYYYTRKLIDEKTFRQLKEDMLGMVNLVEEIAQAGQFAPQTKYHIYLSAISVEANSFYARYDNNVLSNFLAYSMKPIIIRDTSTCAIHKKWLESLKKYATLITQSNEILQVKYFNKQRNYIENIETNPMQFFY